MTLANHPALSAHPEQQYLDLLRELIKAPARQTRNDTATHSVFGRQMRFDLADGFPLLTTKKVFWRGVVAELIWLLSGDTNITSLQKQGIKIWDEWADEYGNLGPVYGHLWRNYGARPDSIRRPKPQLRAGVEADFCFVASKSGYSRAKADDLTEKLYQTWSAMILRCYHDLDDTFSWYGRKGVHVVDRWLEFSAFLVDALTLEGWDQKVANWSDYQLDKDILGDGFTYGPDSCVWASRSDNRKATYDWRHYVRHDNGETAVVENPVEFYTERDLHQGNFCSMLRGDRPVAQGWRLIGSERKNKGVDQIAEVLQSLRDDPYGRRHIISTWNSAQTKDMALPPCHGIAIQFYVGADDRLNLSMYQRSADVFLGAPFNIASYALLLEMFAAVLGRLPGEFVYFLGDAHLYSNHIAQAEEQVSRAPKPFPKISVCQIHRDMDHWTAADIQLVNYDPWPAIKADVSA